MKLCKKQKILIAIGAVALSGLTACWYYNPSDISALEFIGLLAIFCVGSWVSISDIRNEQ